MGHLDDINLLREVRDHAQRAPQPGLRIAFPATIEQAFVDYRYQRSVTLLRLSCSVALVLYFGFLVFDMLTARRLLEPLVLLLVFGVSSPAALILLLSAIVPAWQRYSARIAPPAVLANGIALAMVAIYCDARAIPFPYEVLMLNLMYTFFLAGLLFRVALPIGLLIVGVFLAGDIGIGVSGVTLSDRIFTLGSMLVLSSIACYLFERGDRHRWLQAHLLEDLVVHDQLTGLHTRRFALERGELLLRQAQRDKKPLAVLIADIDLFKDYNDSLGHLAGDDCLRRVAAEFRRGARRPLDLAARIGGEEFLLMLFDCAPQDARKRAEQIRQQVQALAIPHPAAPGGCVTVSLGLTVADGDSERSLTQLIGRADQFLYEAKTAGRNAVCGEPGAS